jgi:ubiquinone/menaquinone biosynthesis C-methylase UbiE
MIDSYKDPDWNEIWMSRMKSNRESSSFQDYARIWESRESALRFWNTCQENFHRTEAVIRGTDINADSRILDIGAGPGTLAIPFSAKVAQVTALEPAEGMCSVMREKMAEYEVSNIDIVQKRWEDVEVDRDLEAPYDVVIASFSLGMFDIRSAIEKMLQASSRYVYLYHFAGPTSWDRQWHDLWPKLHNREYLPGPKSDVLYNVLYQMGIYPNVSTFWLEHNQKYSNQEEAMQMIAHQAQAETDEQKAILREYLRGAMREVGGELALPGSSVRVKIWWEKGK